MIVCKLPAITVAMDIYYSIQGDFCTTADSRPRGHHDLPRQGQAKPNVAAIGCARRLATWATSRYEAAMIGSKCVLFSHAKRFDSRETSRCPHKISTQLLAPQARISGIAPPLSKARIHKLNNQSQRPLLQLRNQHWKRKHAYLVAGNAALTKREGPTSSTTIRRQLTGDCRTRSKTTNCQKDGKCGRTSKEEAIM